MKIKVIVTIMFSTGFALVGTGLAETCTVELSELIGDLHPYPNGSSASFKFGNSFLQIDQVSIQVIGTFTPGVARSIYSGGLIEILPEIEAYMEPGVGSCFTFLYPLKSSFDIDKAFVLKYGSTWDFLLDGTGELTSNLLWGGGTPEWVIELPPTVEISEAYLIIEGVIPEPATILLFGFGSYLLRKRG